MLTTGSARLASHDCWLITGKANLSLNLLTAVSSTSWSTITRSWTLLPPILYFPKKYTTFTLMTNLQVTSFFRLKIHFFSIRQLPFFANVVYAYTHVIYAKDSVVTRRSHKKKGLTVAVLNKRFLCANKNVRCSREYPTRERFTRAIQSASGLLSRKFWNSVNW